MAVEQDWVKAHSRLMRGKWRGVPRAWRFVLLELSLESKPLGGVIELPYGATDPIEALVDLLAGPSRKERKEVRDAILFLSQPGVESITFEDANSAIATPFDAKTVAKRARIPSYSTWNSLSSSTFRMRESRELDRAFEELRGDTVNCDAHGDEAGDALEEKRREEIREEEKKGDSKPPSPPRAKPPKIGRRNRTSIGTRIPSDWTPSAKLVDWALSNGCGRDHAMALAEEFRDHWLASADPAAFKSDWDAAYRTWVRKDAKWAKERRATRPDTSTPSLFAPRRALDGAQGELRTNAAGAGASLRAKP